MKMVKILKKKKHIYAFIDASNLFYGGEISLGWKINYKKLINYLKDKYKAEKIFYYCGIETYDFQYSSLDYKPINLSKLIDHLDNKLKNDKLLKEDEKIILEKNIQKTKFYKRLEEFGYDLKLKPVKTYKDEKSGESVKKANCDVDMAFDLMRLISEYQGVVILSGDGDFIPILSHLLHKKRAVTILAREERTAKELKQLAGGDFRDFHYLREKLKFTNSHK